MGFVLPEYKVGLKHLDQCVLGQPARFLDTGEREDAFVRCVSCNEMKRAKLQSIIIFRD